MRYITSISSKFILAASVIFNAFGVNYADGSTPPFNIASKEQKVIYPLVKSYVPINIKSNFFYNGKLVDQVLSGFEVISSINTVDKNNKLVAGWRYQDGDNRSAVIIDKHHAIRLVAIRADSYTHNFKRNRFIAVFYKEKSNIKYVNDIIKPLLYGLKKSDYQFILYDLNQCPSGKSVSINACHHTSWK